MILTRTACVLYDDEFNLAPASYLALNFNFSNGLMMEAIVRLEVLEHYTNSNFCLHFRSKRFILIMNCV